jgi:beta-glucosidase
MIYQDPTQPVEARVDDLISRMTLEEKAAQLIQVIGWPAYRKEGQSVWLAEDFKHFLSGAGIGSLYGLLRADPWTGVTVRTGLSPREGAVVTNLVQRYARENTRLGIPLLIGGEALHGYMSIGGTMTPGPLLGGSTWNPALWQELTASMAAEMRAQGTTVVCTPNLDLAREPRWGRTEETFGEDPYLVSAFGAAAIRGFQGESLASDHAVIATPKHLVHGAPEGGRNTASAHIGPRELRELYLPPFKAAIAAGAATIMPSYNDLDGLPCTASAWLLTHLLREEWGFEGATISDMGAPQMLWEGHRLAADKAGAAALALSAGIDIEMCAGTSGVYETLVESVRAGRVPEALVDRAVRRVLRVKFQAGLFENPYADPDQAEARMGCARHRQLARTAAQQGLVLLRNQENLLPLKPGLRTIAVIGPNADNIYNQLGDYSAPQPAGKIITVLKGIQAAVGPETRVVYAQGCAVRDPSTAGFAQAVEMARQADVAVVVVGGSSARDFAVEDGALPAAVEPQVAGPMGQKNTTRDMETGEGFDRTSLDLAGAQLELVQAVAATGTPVVVVLITGRPLTIPWIVDNIPAILLAWYPGEEGGSAIADVLFGKVCPGGKLTVSWPRAVGQLPVYYNHKPQGWNPYVEMDNRPLFPFGYGLSYTSFTYDHLTVTPAKIAAQECAQVCVEVTNTGAVTGDEIVQLYVHDEASSVVRPVKELKGFQRVTLRPGETKMVAFALKAEDLGVWDAEMQYVIEPGVFAVTVGGNSVDGLRGEVLIYL